MGKYVQADEITLVNSDIDTTENVELFNQQISAVEGDNMRNLYILLVLYIVSVIFNLFMPLFKPLTFAYKNLFQHLVNVFHTLEILGCFGYKKRSFMITYIVIIRIIEILYAFFIRKWNINIYVLIVLCVLDLVYFLVQVYDASHYEIKDVPYERRDS